ncbi:MAG: glycoside hydrolase family 2 [Pirellulaceae bacterium]|nr:glycoside hydrolase family 2 [Pirellulaceae bacterium]
MNPAQLLMTLTLGACLWVVAAPSTAPAQSPNTNASPSGNAAVTGTKWKLPSDTMMTRWGRDLTADNVWTEYPRPQFVRADKWRSLNGLWKYAITHGPSPKAFKDEILVPFPIESALSGVQHLLEPDEVLWYQRELKHQTPAGHRTKLHFEAVDYETIVYINGAEVGRHVGSSDPFSFDITDRLAGDTNTLLVKVIDKTATTQTLGKQKLSPKGIYYTRVSGIWQSVWIEDVPSRHIAMVKMKPRIKEGTLRVLPTLGGQKIEGEKLRITVRDGDDVVGIADAALSVTIANAKLWSPDSPHLYDITMELFDDDDQLLDKVQSYAAMREIDTWRGPAGHVRMRLNGKVIFHYGPLDQGWWPDGLLTPPSDEAMRFDVDYLKAAGFNMIRKHIKVEPRRFYSYCDRIGMLVWQDMPSTGGRPFWSKLAPYPDEETWPAVQHEQFVAELSAMVNHLRNHPSIVMWVPFNERWGQHETIRIGQKMENLDVTRLINIASGGNFFPVGDVADRHDYPEPKFPLEDRRLNDYVKVVGEFGGHGWVVPGHQWNPDMRNWGYGDLPRSHQEYKDRYRKSFETLMKLRNKGVAGAVYTQTTDVEGEVNGLMTYDRDVQKLTAKELAELHEPAKF